MPARFPALLPIALAATLLGGCATPLPESDPGQRVATEFGRNTRLIAYQDVQFSEDSRQAAFLAAGGEIMVYDVDRRLAIVPFGWEGGGSRPVLAFLPDGRGVAYAAEGRPLAVWDAATGRPLGRAPWFGQVAALDASPRGNALAAVSDDGSLTVLSFPEMNALAFVRGERSAALCVAFSPTGDRVALGRADGQVLVVDVASRRVVLTPPRLPRPVRAVTWTVDGTGLLVAGGALRLLDASTGATRAERGPIPERVRLAGAFRPATAEPLGAAAFWSEMARLRPAALAFNADGRLAVALRDAPGMGTVLETWDTARGARTGGPLLVGRVGGLAVTADGARIATAGDTVRFWDAARLVEGGVAELPVRAAGISGSVALPFPVSAAPAGGLAWRVALGPVTDLRNVSAAAAGGVTLARPVAEIVAEWLRFSMAAEGVDVVAPSASIPFELAVTVHDFEVTGEVRNGLADMATDVAVTLELRDSITGRMLAGLTHISRRAERVREEVGPAQLAGYLQKALADLNVSLRQDRTLLDTVRR